MPELDSGKCILSCILRNCSQNSLLLVKEQRIKKEIKSFLGLRKLKF